MGGSRYLCFLGFGCRGHAAEGTYLYMVLRHHIVHLYIHTPISIFSYVGNCRGLFGMSVWELLNMGFAEADLWLGVRHSNYDP